MIQTDLLSGQGLGNQLWLIFAVQSLAQGQNLDFEIRGKDELKADFPNLRLEAPMTTRSIKEAPLVREIQLLHPVTGENITRYDPDLASRIGNGARLEGYFQSEMYLQNVEDLKSQLKLDGSVFDGCTISLRGGEYRGIPKVFLPKGYFLHAIDLVKRAHGSDIPFRVVTDDVQLAHEWFPGLPVFSSGGVKRLPFLPYFHPKKERVLRDFSLIQNSRAVITSNSSFSWWGAYSSITASTVVGPKYWAAFNTSNGYWSQGDSVTQGWDWIDRQGDVWSSEDCMSELQAFRSQNEWA